jgi:hypothetical protein
MRRVDDDWADWAMARCAIAFALEAEVREAAAGDDLLWSLDADGALESLERLGDALAAALREIVERPPPAPVRPFRDALVRYLGWRTDFNDQMVRAAEFDGWAGARAVYEAEVAAGLPLFHAFQEELAALQSDHG